MASISADIGVTYRMRAEDLGALFSALHAANFLTIGPRLSGDAIILEELNGPEDLPIGWGDEQEAGRYRLRRREDQAFFGYNLGPESWKKFLTPQRQLLWRARRQRETFTIEQPERPSGDPQQLAFIGVRACELAAMRVQERVREVSGQPANDLIDAKCKAATPFLVGVTCAQSAATCFCTSMGTGPALGPPGLSGVGYDLALTEFPSEDDHHFTIEVRSERGADIASRIPRQLATENECDGIRQQSDTTAALMTRHLKLDKPAQLFQDSLEHRHWDDVALRCLSCANCTLVCPTCFCTNIEDTSDLSGDVAERWLRWDSCFHLDFSYLHGGSVRQTTRSRYRQWLTHKLGTWHEQFGSSGCVGCGRCIAWCPVGIDLTLEIKALTLLPAVIGLQTARDEQP